MIPDITLIEQVQCPKCKVPPVVHCEKLAPEQETGIRIWPWFPGAAGPDWCHKERRDAAVARGLVKTCSEAEDEEWSDDRNPRSLRWHL